MSSSDITLYVLPADAVWTWINPKQTLNLCVTATQNMVDSVAATFGLSMGGHNAMLEKLKKLQEDMN